MKNKLELIKRIIQVIEEEVLLSDRFHSAADAFCPEKIYLDLIRHVIETEQCVPNDVSLLIAYVNTDNMVVNCEMQSITVIGALEIELRFVDK